MDDIIKRTGDRFTISGIREQREDLSFFTVDKNDLYQCLVFMRDFEDFTHLSFITTIDLIEDNRIRLVYMLYNYTRNVNMGIHVDLDRDKPEMESIHHLWEQASTYQRELWEMMGVDFPGSPRIGENFLLEGWDNMPPMRRDFDTKAYAETTFFPREGRKRYDPREYMKSKLYPEGEQE